MKSKDNPKGIIMLKPETLDTHFPRSRAIKRLGEYTKYSNTVSERWNTMMRDFNAIRDPLLVSLMKHSREVEFSDEKKKLVIAFPDHLTFFKDLLESTLKDLWKPLIEKKYGEVKRIEVLFGVPYHE